MEVRDFLAQEFFRPLKMKDSFLGRRNEDRSGIADSVLTPDLVASVINWNSDYFHRIGNYWGGVFSTVRDYARFLQMLLNGGEYQGVRTLWGHRLFRVGRSRDPVVHDPVLQQTSQRP